MPAAVGDSPVVETDRSRVDIAAAEPIGERRAGLIPRPGGEIRTPFFCAGPWPTRRVTRGRGVSRRSDVPVLAELVAERIRRRVQIPHLGLRRADDPGTQALRRGLWRLGGESGAG